MVDRESLTIRDTDQEVVEIIPGQIFHIICAMKIREKPLIPSWHNEMKENSLDYYIHFQNINRGRDKTNNNNKNLWFFFSSNDTKKRDFTEIFIHLSVFTNGPEMSGLGDVPRSLSHRLHIIMNSLLCVFQRVIHSANIRN